MKVLFRRVISRLGVADVEFDVSDSAFQNEFAELTKPGSSANDFAVLAPQRENRRFDI
jgi:hypothetical protein